MFSLNLRKLRREKKLTQAQLAEALNVSNVTVALWETNKRLPDIIALTKLANYFNVSTDALLDRETQPPRIVDEMQPIYTEKQQRCLDMLLLLDEVKLDRLESYLIALTESEATFILNKVR